MSIDEAPQTAPFRWQDGERVIVFGRGRLAEAHDLIREPFALLTTPRAEEHAPRLLELAASVHEVPSGRVDELAGALLGEVNAPLLVALGGGRVIDTAKAIAAAHPPWRVAAIPTTLSGAEMTAVHRHAAGMPSDTPRVRPAIVLNDPQLSASQAVAELARSAGNALGHLIEGPATIAANPVAEMAAVAGARLIGRGFATDSVEDSARDALGLAALLAGYVIGSTGYGLHHVLAQTLARFGGVPHAAANTIMLPHTTRALAERAPGWMARLRAGLGGDPGELARRLHERSGLGGLRGAGLGHEDLEVCAQQASERPELAMTPPPARLAEVQALYHAAL